MRNSVKCCVLILAATLVAVALRLPRPAQRPMHGDEAVHADKFADLVKKLRRLLGDYKGLKSIGEHARKKVEVEYNWDEIVRKTELVYDSLKNNK